MRTATIRRTVALGVDVKSPGDGAAFALCVARLLRHARHTMAKGQLERALMAFLKKGSEERFRLDPRAQPALQRALQADLRRRDALACLTAVLRLAAAFDDQLRSPTVAAGIRALLKAEPRAVELLRKSRAKPSSLDAARRFAREEGRAVVLRAPSLREAPPAGTLSLRSFLDTGNTRMGRKPVEAFQDERKRTCRMTAVELEE